MDLAEFNYDGEPYPVPQIVFDRLVEKFVSGGEFTEREKTVWGYLTDVNEVALMERKLALAEMIDDLDVSDEQLEAFGMAADDATDDTYVWRSHDGSKGFFFQEELRPFSHETYVRVRFGNAAGFEDVGQCGSFAWWWGGHSDTNIVAYRLARPEELGL
jgi:hypothetical protein